ncbi:polysaccharide biosynthesis/export family protein [Sphingobium aquiterrae]|uniref:polysaccharide biosynthesis/export family protein n=1 Tax=Sphingobium aquiterrae TaxID=2038656 RepID=UPI003015BEE6
MVFLATACAAGGGGEVISTGERYAAPMANEEYRLDTGDKIRLNVFNEPTLSGEFAVGSEGTVSLPLVGEVVAKDKTPQKLAAEVQTKLADGYLREPKVGIEVATYRPFFILGEVSAPGQYPYANGLTVMNAIATAQGFTPRADKKVAYIRRAGATREEPLKLTPSLRVFPGDTIRLGERYF